MAGEKCDICGKGPFKTPQALAGHKKFAHGEKGKKPKPTKTVPDVVNDFELLLKQYGVKKADLIANHITDTSSPNIFDKPKELAKKLAKWPKDIAPMYRASILEHWLKSRGIILPEELLEELGNYLKLVRDFHSSVPEPHLAKLRVCSPSNWVEPSSFLRYSLGSQPIELSPLKEAVYGRLRPIDRLD